MSICETMDLQQGNGRGYVAEHDDDRSQPWSARPQKLAQSARDAVLNALHNVKVCKYDATQLERELQGELLDKWHESWEMTEVEGISIDKLTDYLDHLEDAYDGVDEKIRKKLNSILITDKSWKEKIIEWKFDQGQKSEARYGMIALAKSPDGKYVDSMYVMYKLNFKIAPKREVTVTKTESFWGFFSETHVDVQVIERSVGALQLTRLQNLFRLKAMEGFLKEGFIKSINYVDSLDANTDDSKK